MIRRISTEQGLSSTDTWSVLRDHSGFIWIGTLDGLNRYDGYGMKVFKSVLTDPTTLSDSPIRTVYEDRSGVLWIGTWFGGLNRFDRKTESFTRFQHDPANPNSLSSDSVYAILEDQTGAFWLGTRDGGLNRFDPETGDFTAYRHDPDDPTSLGNDNIYALAEDADGTIWLATDNGLDRFNPITETFRHYRNDPEDPASLSNNVIRSLLVDSAGTVWAGTWGGGLNRFDRQSEGFSHYRNEPDNPNSLSNDAVMSIKQAANGALWIGTLGGGPNWLDPQTGRFQRLGTESEDPWALEATAVYDFLEEDGLLWLATNNDIFVLDLQPKRFQTFQHEPNNDDSLASNEIDSIYADPQGILWVATGSTGLNRIDRTTGEVTHFQENPADPASSSANEIWEIAPDGDGKLWLATFGDGLKKFDPETGESLTYRNNPDDRESLGSDRVTSVVRDQSGTVWVGTWDAGLDRFDPATGAFSHYVHDPDDPHSLSDNTIMMVTEDHNGELWIGTLNGGLNRFDRATETFTRYQGEAGNPQSLPANAITAVLLDRAGRIWVGTLNGGLARLNIETGEATVYDQSDHLPADSVFSILEDARGRLWLSTSNGLSRFDPNTGSFRNYDVDDGLPGNVFEASTAFQSPSGEMFFGASNGLLAFYPDQIDDNPTVPPVVITDLLLANDPVPIGEDSVLQQAIDETDRLTLSYRDRVISFEFSALNYAAPHKNRYRYMLDGFDEGWTEVGSERRLVTYTNLDPGDYTFHVLGSNNDGAWNEEGASLALTITPPWWDTLGFRTLVSFLFVGLIAAVFVGERRRATIQQRNLEAKVQARTRELLDARTQITTLFDSSPLGIAMATLDGNILGVNRSMQRISGYTEDELLQSDVSELYANPQERVQLLEQLSANGYLSNYGTQLRRRDGSHYYASLNLSRLAMAGQDIVLGITDDITDEVNARNALTALHQISYDLATIADVDGLLEHAFQSLHKILDFRRAAFMIFRDGEESLTLYAYGSPDLTIQQIPLNSWPFLQTIVAVRDTVYVPDIHANKSVQAELDNLDIEEWSAVLSACKSWLCIPLLVGERIIGVLNIVHKAADHYDANTIEIARTFANQLAVAMDNIHHTQQAQVAAVTDERSRIARDLHDSVTQTLFTASVLAEAAPLIWTKNPELARQNMEKLSILIRGALSEMRSLLLELRADTLPNQTLDELLPVLVEAVRMRTNAVISINVEGDCQPPPEVTMTFYRIAQEALNNVARHAEAFRVDITLQNKPDGILLHIRDDGRGFDPQNIPAGHLGLSIMAERAKKIGGQLQIHSEPGHGTELTITWPDAKERENHG